MLDPKNMKLNKKDGVCYLTFPELECFPFARHAFSTRIGGVSRGEFSSMNLAFRRGDSPENVRENYRRFCEAAGFDDRTLVSSVQDHHTVVRRVGRENRGEGFSRPKALQSVDGLITDEPGVTLVTHYADCVPLFLIDPRKKAIGLIHAGWRGTVAKIGAAAVETLQKEFGSSPEDLTAAIGPSIGPCCFEVDSPVRDRFAELTELHPLEWIRENEGEKFHINLWEVNRRVLMEAGIKEENIHIGGVCTQCSADWLFSHRASGGKRGGLAAFLAIREDDTHGY